MFYHPSIRTLSLCIIALSCVYVFAEDSRTKEVLAVDDARIAAMVSADSRLLEPLLSEDLQYSHSTGAVDTKKTFLSLINKKETRYVTYQPLERTVAFASPEIAFVNGRAEIGVQHDGQQLKAHCHRLFFQYSNGTVRTRGRCRDSNRFHRNAAVRANLFSATLLSPAIARNTEVRNRHSHGRHLPSKPVKFWLPHQAYSPSAFRE